MAKPCKMKLDGLDEQHFVDAKLNTSPSQVRGFCMIHHDRKCGNVSVGEQRNVTSRVA